MTYRHQVILVAFAIAFATHAEAALKVPLSMLRVSGGKWIHDVTLEKEDV